MRNKFYQRIFQAECSYLLIITKNNKTNDDKEQIDVDLLH